MFDLKKILLPIDFSESSEAVAPYARAFAEQFKSELFLLHIEHSQGLLRGLRGRAQNKVRVERKSNAASQLDSLSSKEFQGLSVSRQVVEGEPAAKIVEFAHTEQIDLIMIPTRGCGRYRRFLLGSVTAKVLHDSDCPVWTSVHIEAAVHREPVCHKIACAIDLGPHTEKVLQWASGMVSASDAELLLLHATAPIDPFVEEASGPRARVQLMEDAREKVERLLRKMNIQAEIQVDNGLASEVIYRHAARFPADLLVIGRHAASGIAGRLHPHAYAIIRDSPCPVVSI